MRFTREQIDAHNAKMRRALVTRRFADFNGMIEVERWSAMNQSRCRPVRSRLETKFMLIWTSIGGPIPMRELKMVPNRKFRWDFAWPGKRVAVEVEGGTWMGKHGAHSSGRGIKRDCDKGNLATLAGWRFFRLTADMINRPCLERIKEFIMTSP